MLKTTFLLIFLCIVHVNTNYLVNGNFSSPLIPPGSSQLITQTLNGWIGAKFVLVPSNAVPLPSNMVANSSVNSFQFLMITTQYACSQLFELPTSDTYTLSLSWLIKATQISQNVSTQSIKTSPSILQIFWNSLAMLNLTSSSSSSSILQQTHLIVKSNGGRNNLTLQSLSKSSQSLAFLITNVSVSSICHSPELNTNTNANNTIQHYETFLREEASYRLTFLWRRKVTCQEILLNVQMHWNQQVIKIFVLPSLPNNHAFYSETLQVQAKNGKNSLFLQTNPTNAYVGVEIAKVSLQRT